MALIGEGWPGNRVLKRLPGFIPFRYATENE